MNESNAQGSAPLPNPARGTSKRVWWAVGLGLALMVGVTIYLVACFLSAAARLTGGLPPREGTIIASFRNDFQPSQPKPGWRYCWNRDAPLDDTNYYVDLVWNGQLYATTNTPLPALPPGRYLRLSRGTGHPGQGPSQTTASGAQEERAVIIAFSVPQAGRYVLARSFISRHAGGKSGSVHLKVFAKGSPVGAELYCRTTDQLPFDRELGQLATGDTIYVCIGPDETDQDDSFDVDFAIGRL
jgi:hypothetical protein